MYSLWEIEKRHRAQFAVWSKFHAFLDLLNDLLLILAAMNIQPANSYREVRQSSLGLGRVLSPIMVAFGLWMLRMLEIALLSPREAARRQAAGDLVGSAQLLCIWGAAYTLAVKDFDDPDTNARMSDFAAALMWFGNVWWVCKQMMRTLSDILLPGALALERSMVCANSGFSLHRNNECVHGLSAATVLPAPACDDAPALPHPHL